MTLNGVITVILRYFAEFGSFGANAGADERGGGKGLCPPPKPWIKKIKTQDRRMQQMRFVDSYALNKNVFSLFRCLSQFCMLYLV